MAVAAQPSRIASPTVHGLVRRRLAELAGLGLALGGLLLLVALVSYDSRDPSLNTATAHSTANLVGRPGAVVADILLQGFGCAGALPALAMLAWAWRIATHRGLPSLAVRLAALLAAMPVLGAVLALMPGPTGEPLNWPVAAGLGGATGRVLADAALEAGRGLLGPLGGVAMAALGAAFALTLTLLALGLAPDDWVAAWRGARMGGGRAGRLFRIVGGAPVRVVSAGVRRFRRQEQSAVEHQAEPPRGSRFAAPPMPEDEETSQPARVVAATSMAATGQQPTVVASATQGQSSVAAPPPPARPAASVVNARVAPTPKRPAVTAHQESLPLEGPWRCPPLSLLTTPPSRASIGAPSEETLRNTAELLIKTLNDYGVQGHIVEIRPGPVVTLYELEPAPGIRSARVIGLADDIARSLSVTAVRIATVPGRNVIGIELPNAKRETVYLSELLASDDWKRNQGKLTLALGKDIGGGPIIADLARMPHLLVAGTTGSGKSVGINAMILSLLYRLSPDQCRLILIDPKMLELSVYDGIPHLMAPVVTEPAKAVIALKWTVREMERRYRAMSGLSVRNIGSYNERVHDARAKGEVMTRRVQTGFDSETGRPMFEEQPLPLDPMPLLVVVIDEMADLMMVAGKEIEAAVQRLAQMARAAGIHVVMATQRPSVDVITGTIKANFPTRISFQVISKFDSRTILGEQGAEQLLGQGDMLHMQGGGRIARVHGPFVSDREVEEIVAYLREQGEPAYVDEVTELPEASDDGGGTFSGIAGASDGEKGLFDQAVALVAREGKASTSFIQRHLQIGYNRAARLIEQMEKEGIVGPANHVGKREVLARRTFDDDE